MKDIEKTSALEPGELPRRVRLSIREIGVAVALTLAALAQLWFALDGRDRGVAEQAAQSQGTQPGTPKTSTP